MSRTRGMTLLEVVVSISILGALFVVAARWTAQATHLEAQSSEVLWECSARALLDRIEEAVREGDFEEDQAARPTLEAGTLSVRGRKLRSGTGFTKTRFSWAQAAGEILLERDGRREVALGSVSRFETRLDRKQALLEIVLESRSGRRLAREVSLP
jgi:prepilin-type N-terminal cleavage/methylation domain-containing protein